MTDRPPLAATIHAFAIIIGMLAEDLEQRGALSRKDFAKRLRAIADEAEATAPPELQGPRLDLQIARHLAHLLDKPSQAKGWTPVVIEGGPDSSEPEAR